MIEIAVPLIYLSPIALMAYSIWSTWRPSRPAPAWVPAPRAKVSFRIPSAEETAESVRRFQAAAERAAMLDLVWDRYSQGRALIVERIYRIKLAGRGRRRPRPIPELL